MAKRKPLNRGLISCTAEGLFERVARKFALAAIGATRAPDQTCRQSQTAAPGDRRTRAHLREKHPNGRLRRRGKTLKARSWELKVVRP